jgi:hypothetical protein
VGAVLNTVGFCLFLSGNTQESCVLLY